MATTTFPYFSTDEIILMVETLQDGVEYLETERERVSDWEEGDVTAHLADLDARIKARKDFLEKISGFPERIETAKKNILEYISYGEVPSAQQIMAGAKVEYTYFLAAIEELIDEGETEKSGAGYKKPW